MSNWVKGTGYAMPLRAAGSFGSDRVSFNGVEHPAHANASPKAAKKYLMIPPEDPISLSAALRLRPLRVSVWEESGAGIPQTGEARLNLPRNLFACGGDALAPAGRRARVCFAAERSG